MQTGADELPQFDEFLVKWIAYLGRKTGWRVEKFLREAQAMMQDKGDLTAYLEKYDGICNKWLM